MDLISILLLIIGGLIFFIIRNQPRDKRRQFVIATQPSPIPIDPLAQESWEIDGEWDDGYQSFTDEEVTETPATGRYWISYLDAQGRPSAREIVVSGVNEYLADSLIKAQCLLRHANRSFRQSRIQKAIDVQTGEIIDDLAEHAINAYRNSPAGRADELFRREEAALCVLVYVARADGRMMKPERQVIINYLKTRHEDVLVDDSDIDQHIKGRWFPSDEKEFKRQVLTLAEADQKRYAHIASAAQAIVATQKTIAPAEKMALEYLATYAPSSLQKSLARKINP